MQSNSGVKLRFRLTQSFVILIISFLLFIGTTGYIDTASAEDATYGIFYYDLVGDDSEVRITGLIGVHESVTIPSEIIGKPVTGIAQYAFVEHTFLKTVTIPASVDYIEYFAFYNCYNLIGVTFKGDAPNCDPGIFINCNTYLVVYHEPDAYGFTHPWWMDVGCQALGESPGGDSILALTISRSSGTGTVPLSVTFSSTASGGSNPYTYLWNFDDGTTSAIANPTHSFSKPGTYTVVLEVTDNHGTKISKSAIISVIPDDSSNDNALNGDGVFFLFIIGFIGILIVAVYVYKKYKL